jgi:hypothetical protein
MEIATLIFWLVRDLKQLICQSDSDDVL